MQDKKMWLVAAISGLVLVWLGSACNPSVVEPGGVSV